MLDWREHPAVGFADSETSLVRLTVSNADWVRQGERYVGRVANASWRVIRESEEFDSFSAAKTWCENAYAELLAAELARVRG